MSHLLKLLDTVTLASDSLQDLETFHDTIQFHISTVTTSSMIFPKYRDITQKFTFYHHLCSQETNPKLNPGELHQSKLNYGTFGSGLRQFILNPNLSQRTQLQTHIFNFYLSDMNKMDFYYTKTSPFYKVHNWKENLLTTGMKSAS